MNDLLKKLSSLKNTTLSEKERVEMRRDIVAFMKANPMEEVVNINSSLPTTSFGRRMNADVHSHPSLDVVRNAHVARHHTYAGIFTAFNTVKRKRMISAILFTMFVLSGGVSYAAEGSLPGDMLYPVKINVNERVESALAIGAEADANFARKQFERRAEEAVQLSAEHRLSAEVKAELAADAEVHAEAYKKAEATLTHEGKSATAIEVKTQMQTTIDTHEEGLSNLGVHVDLDAVSSVNVEQRNDSSVGTTSDGDESEGEATGTLNADVKTQGEVKIELPPVLPSVHTETEGSGLLKVGL